MNTITECRAPAHQASAHTVELVYCGGAWRSAEYADRDDLFPADRWSPYPTTERELIQRLAVIQGALGFRGNIHTGWAIRLIGCATRTP